MNETYNSKTGNRGEDMSVKWLLEKGFTVIERNWRFKHLEVDVIASKGNKLHFFEIKTRTTDKYGHPEESIGKKKMQHMRKAAEEYQYQHPQWIFLQIDVLAIKMYPGQAQEIFYIEDVFF